MFLKWWVNLWPCNFPVHFWIWRYCHGNLTHITYFRICYNFKHQVDFETWHSREIVWKPWPPVDRINLEVKCSQIACWCLRDAQKLSSRFLPSLGAVGHPAVNLYLCINVPTKQHRNFHLLTHKEGNMTFSPKNLAFGNGAGSNSFRSPNLFWLQHVQLLRTTLNLRAF